MSWIERSLPPEAEDPPPAPPTEIERLAIERDRLCALIRPRVRSRRQDRIRSRIEEITRQILSERRAP